MTTDLRDQLQSTLGSSYTLDHELGGGGMSRVFVADETALGRKVVVKVLRPDLAEGISADRFRREIQLAAQLQQANIVPVLSAGITDGLPYYTMPFVEGESVRALLARNGARPVNEVVKIAADVARALAYAHDKGVVHRDIKPDNVLRSGGTAVVTDFGIAKAITAARGEMPNATLTSVGTSIGTPAYMAPEQAAGDPSTDHRADLYSLGVMMYELLAGQPPFHGLTPQKLLAAQMGQTPAPITDFRPDCPPSLAALIAQLLEKDPTLRPNRAVEVLQTLETVATTPGTSYDALPIISIASRRALVRALGIYAAAFIGAAILSRAAIVGIGLPDWVFPATLVVMALGLPVILFTAFVHHGSRVARTMALVTTPGGSPAGSTTMTRIAVKASPFVSWRRTAFGGVAAVAGLVLLVAGYMTTRAMGIGPAASLMSKGLLGEREQLMVADFKSPASDSTLGPTVTEALRGDLAQSRNLTVTQATTVRDVLQRMQRPVNSRLDFALARELATREGIKALLDGEVLGLGGGYVLSAKLIATQTGDVLASFQETADKPSDLIPAIGRLSKAVRTKVGESLRTVQATPTLDRVTTNSLDALRKYTAGVHASDIEGNLPKAASLLREAVAIDTGFAEAWRKLSVVLNNAVLDPAGADSAITRAYQHRDRLGFVEQQHVIANYFEGPGNDRRRALAAYEAMVEHDSSDDRIYNNYALLLRRRREYARAEAMYWRVVRSQRPIWQAYSGVLVSQINQGKIADARKTLEEWRRALPGPRAELNELNLLAQYQEPESLTAALQRAGESRDAQNRVLAKLVGGNLARAQGRLREAERLIAEGDRENAARGAAVPLDLTDSLNAISDAIWFRDVREAGVRRLDAVVRAHPWRSLPDEQRAYFRIATLYALAGSPERARGVLQQWTADHPDPATRSRSDAAVHTVEGHIALAERRFPDAIAEYRRADELPDGPAGDCAHCLWSNLARAYDLAGNADSALAYFERYVKTPYYLRMYNSTLDPLVLAGAHKRLGELYEAKGDRANATSHYTKFVDLWKNADPELQPQVAEVKQRLAHLKDTEARR